MSFSNFFFLTYREFLNCRFFFLTWRMSMCILERPRASGATPYNEASKAVWNMYIN